MNYEFSLSKNGVISLIAGSVVFGCLLFLAGLVVGSYWLTSESAVTQSATAKNEKDELPKEPVLSEPQAPAPKSAAPKDVNPAASQPKPPAAPATPAAATATTATMTAPPAGAPGNDGEVKIVQEAGADPASASAETDPEYVTVQVGVFLNQNEANHLLQQIESKGYAPTFFSGRDAEARQWYAVRIGAYSDRQQALNAAVNFSKQEKLKAVVRPLGSL
jgi:cell division septation protein DedD